MLLCASLTATAPVTARAQPATAATPVDSPPPAPTDVPTAVVDHTAEGSTAAPAASGSGAPTPPGSAPAGTGPPPPGYPGGYGATGYANPPGMGPGPPPPSPPTYPFGYGDPAALPPPGELPYEAGQPIPEGYHLSSRIHKGLVIAGAVTFGTFYLISAGVAAAYLDDRAQIAEDAPESAVSDAEAYAPLFVPLAGPFIALATVEPTATGTMALVLDGVAQSAGLAMLIAGLALRSEVLVRNDLGSVRWTLAPTAVAGRGAGLGIVGEF